MSRDGTIPFARFMELALYCPVYGYYESEKDKIGRAGDFYTSVSVGPLFGELLAAAGTLVGIASIAGFRGLPGSGAYSASKAAAM